MTTAYYCSMSEDAASAKTSEPTDDGSRGGQMRSLLRSVVKVITVSDAPDYDQPWQTEGPDTAVGSGVIVMTPRGARV